MLNALQSQMKRAPLSAESTISTPPLTLGWFATIPATRPPILANPVMISWAKSRLISKKEPASTIRSMTSYMSNHLRWSYGTISSIGLPGAASELSPLVGRSRYDWGMNSRYRLQSSMASSSEPARMSPQPDTEQCMRAPPSSSSETFSPMAISTMRGEPTYRLALPSTMMTQSVSAGR